MKIAVWANRRGQQEGTAGGAKGWNRLFGHANPTHN